MQVEAVVFFGPEAHRTVIATLDDVPGDAGKGEACVARHGRASVAVNLAEENRGLSPITALLLLLLDSYALPLPRLPARLVGNVLHSDAESNGRLTLNLRSNPDAKLKDLLKLLCGVVPPIVVAQCVGWQIVVRLVLPASTVRKDMVRVPWTRNHAAADVASAASLSKDRLPFRS